MPVGYMAIVAAVADYLEDCRGSLHILHSRHNDESA